MKLSFPITAAVAALAITVSAQDTTVKSRTRIKADDAKVVSLTGCLRQDTVSGDYSLLGTIVGIGDDVKTKSKVKTDVDKNSTKVKSETKTTADATAGTSGAISTYIVIPRNDINLAPHVGHQVQLSAVFVEPGHHDADVKIDDKTKVDPEHGRDTKTTTKTKVELPGSAAGRYSVVAVKSLADTCSGQ